MRADSASDRMRCRSTWVVNTKRRVRVSLLAASLMAVTSAP